MSWQNKENKTGIFFSFGEIQSLQMTPLRLSMTVCMDSDLKKITQLGGPCVCIIMQLVYYWAIVCLKVILRMTSLAELQKAPLKCWTRKLKGNLGLLFKTVLSWAPLLMHHASLPGQRYTLACTHSVFFWRLSHVWNRRKLGLMSILNTKCQELCQVLLISNPCNNSVRKYYVHFTDEENESWSIWVTCLR